MSDVDFMVSHSQQDSQWASWISGVVESLGYTTFLPEKDILIGDSIVAATNDALTQAKHVLALMSTDYFNSAWARMEWTAALASELSGGAQLLLVRIAPVTPPGILIARPYADLVGKAEIEAEREIVRLIQGVLPRSDTPRSTFPGPVIAAAGAGSIEAQVRSSEPRRNSVFISYSHKDRRWLDRLLVHLKPLIRDGGLDIWEDARIEPGSQWKVEIDQALKVAQIGVLLISADFLASDFIVNNELPQLLCNAQDNGAIILQVIVSPSRIEKVKTLKDFQAVNPLERPLTRMTGHQREEFFVRLANVIEGAMQKLDLNE